MKLALLGALAVFALPAASQAATTLLDLPNSVDLGTAYDLAFTAGNATTTLAIYGYNVVNYDFAKGNAVYLNDAGPNLLGSTWLFTPALFGSSALQFADGYGTGANGLQFGGVSTGSWDAFSQTFATVVGQTYNYHLEHFAEYGIGSDFQVRVDSSRVADGVPEPAAWALTVIGFGLMGATIRSGRAARQGA
jgi:hypothetical protein